MKTNSLLNRINNIRWVNFHRIVAVLLIFAFIFAMFGFSDVFGSIRVGGVLLPDYDCIDVSLIDDTSTTLAESVNDWFRVDGTVSLSAPLVITGAVNLILEEGAHLDAPFGIVVNAPNSLTIHARGNDNSLTAVGGANSAGIGSSGTWQTHAGTIVINGGNITATGGAGGAGIGGSNGGIGGTIVINSGNVTANGGERGAGVGGGYNANGGNITINGGVVVATGGAGSSSSHGGAGIGGGCSASGGNITINGGNVTATGARSSAGIGGGGGWGSPSGTIRLYGGNITANGGAEGGHAIGGSGAGSSASDSSIIGYPGPSNVNLSPPNSGLENSVTTPPETSATTTSATTTTPFVTTATPPVLPPVTTPIAPPPSTTAAVSDEQEVLVTRPSPNRPTRPATTVANATTTTESETELVTTPATTTSVVTESVTAPTRHDSGNSGGVVLGSGGITPVDPPGGGGSGGRGSGSGFFGGSTTTISIGGWEMLLFAPLGARTWALSNLILGILGAALMVVNIIRAVKRKRDELNGLSGDDIIMYAEELSRDSGRMLTWLVVSSVVGVFGIFFFLVFQDSSHIMVLFDFWSAIHITIFATQLIATWFAFKRGKIEQSEIAEIENRAIA